MSEEKIDPTEALIREKIRAGLSRDQAVAVVNAQAEHDAALAKAEKKKGKPAKADKSPEATGDEPSAADAK